MKYAQIREEALSEWNGFADGNRPRILIGTGTCGKAAGADDLLDMVSGLGMCAQGFTPSVNLLIDLVS